jgi:hypothetical protein
VWRGNTQHDIELPVASFNTSAITPLIKNLNVLFSYEHSVYPSALSRGFPILVTQNEIVDFSPGQPPATNRSLYDNSTCSVGRVSYVNVFLSTLAFMWALKTPLTQVYRYTKARSHRNGSGFYAARMSEHMKFGRELCHTYSSLGSREAY